MEQPDKRLNESILRRVKEQEEMKKDWMWKKAVICVTSLACLMAVTVFVYGKFSYIKEDKVVLETEYLGDSASPIETQVQSIRAEDGDLAVDSWIWPTDSREISASYGVNRLNGYFSDHVNIRGEKGDAIYATMTGTIADTGFDKELGNYIVLEDGEGRRVKYGHLDTVDVEMGQTVKCGDIIGEMGKSGMATGVNLYFAVYVDGEAINPLDGLE